MVQKSFICFECEICIISVLEGTTAVYMIIYNFCQKLGFPITFHNTMAVCEGCIYFLPGISSPFYRQQNQGQKDSSTDADGNNGNDEQDVCEDCCIYVTKHKLANAS